MQERYPQYKFDTNLQDSSLDWTVDNSKAERQLGTRLCLLLETVLDMAASMPQLGIANPSLRAGKGLATGGQQQRQHSWRCSHNLVHQSKKPLILSIGGPEPE